MKKITLLSLFVIATVSFSFSQTLKILNPKDSTIVNDSTVTIYGDTGTEMVSTFWIINSNFSTIKVEAKRDLISVLASSYNEICWAGTCYNPSVSVSPVSETIQAHDTAELGNQFNGDYFPQSGVGTSTIRYVFYDSTNTSDSSWVIVKYISKITTGMANLSNKPMSFSMPYPNPANSSVNFSYNLTNMASANLKIFNLLGNCVQTIPLSSLENKITVNTESMPSGIYVCELQANGSQAVYQKMIVSH